MGSPPSSCQRPALASRSRSSWTSSGVRAIQMSCLRALRVTRSPRLTGQLNGSISVAPVEELVEGAPDLGDHLVLVELLRGLALEALLHAEVSDASAALLVALATPGGRLGVVSGGVGHG